MAKPDKKDKAIREDKAEKITNFSLPPDLPVVEGKPGDKFSFTNDTGVNQTLTPPSCLSPPKTDELTASGDKRISRTYTINSGTRCGEYRYSIDDGQGPAGMRTGRIKVS